MRKCVYIVLVSAILMFLTSVVYSEARAAVPDCRSADASFDLASTELARKPGESILLFRRLSIAGHARAQGALARQLDYGFNVPRNQIGAYIWYNIVSAVAAGPPSSWSQACLNITDTWDNNRDSLNFVRRVTQRATSLHRSCGRQIYQLQIRLPRAGRRASATLQRPSQLPKSRRPYRNFRLIARHSPSVMTDVRYRMLRQYHSRDTATPTAYLFG
jgi:hypothetical protein